MVVLAMLLSACPLPTSHSDTDSGDRLPVPQDWSYEVVGSAPEPGNGGAIEVSVNGGAYTIRFAEATDLETAGDDLEYAVFLGARSRVSRSLDLQYYADVEHFSLPWSAYGEFTVPISDDAQPSYLNVGVRDGAGNISAYQAEYVAPEASAATYTVHPGTYSGNDWVEIEVTDGADIVYVISDTAGEDDYSTELIEAEHFSPSGAGVDSESQSVFAGSINGLASGSVSGSAIDSGDGPPGVGVRGFPGQHKIPQVSGTAEGEPDSRDSAVGAATVGTSAAFNTASGTVVATAKATATTGDWDLTVWLDSDDRSGVTQAMVDTLTAQFMQAGDDNDIFDWVTGVYGVPWGPHSDSPLIDSDQLIDRDRRDIHILLYDIDDDQLPLFSSSRTVGYFWPKDNYRQGTLVTDGEGNTFTSNGRLMFYMDSYLLARRDGAAWDIDDFWPAEVVSTLAHELQHMVHYYQRVVTRGTESDTWLNEMASLIAEDVVSEPVGVRGPRGVDPSLEGRAGGSGNPYGRLPEWATEPPVRLDAWSDQQPLPHYAAAYSFGAALVRRYGVGVMTELIAANGETGDAVENAVAATGGGVVSFSSLVSDWAVAMLLSNDTAAPREYRLNRDGWLESSVGGASYFLGSINAHNYGEGLRIVPYSDELSENIPPTSSIYVRMAHDVSGTYSDQLALPAGVQVRVIERHPQ